MSSDKLCNLINTILTLDIVSDKILSLALRHLDENLSRQKTLGQFYAKLGGMYDNL